MNRIAPLFSLLLCTLTTSACDDKTDTDISGDTDTSDTDSDTDTNDMDTDSDTQSAPCSFSTVPSYTDATTEPSRGDSASFGETLDLCFGTELEGRWVRQWLNANDELLCEWSADVTATTALDSADLCPTCDAGFDGVSITNGAVSGPYCDRVFAQASTVPFYCGPGGQIIDVDELSASTTAIFRNGPTDPTQVPAAFSNPTFTVDAAGLSGGITGYGLNDATIPEQEPSCGGGRTR